MAFSLSIQKKLGVFISITQCEKWINVMEKISSLKDWKNITKSIM